MVKNTNNPRIKKILIPGKFYDMKEERHSPTRYRMNPKTGRMTGRYTGVPLNYSDHIRYLVMKYNADVTGDKKADLYRGQIIGRLPSNISNKPSKIIIKLKLKPGQRLKARARPTRVETRGAYKAYKD
jgi:hypothetical protein